MASDEGDEKLKASARSETPPAPKAGDIGTPEAGAGTGEQSLAAGTAGLSEWTASDARGPLAEPIIPAEVPPPHPYDATGFDREPRPVPNMDEAELGADSAPPSASPPGLETPPPETGAGAPAPRRRSVWPVAAAILLGAVIGAGTNQAARMQWSGGGALRRDLAALKIRVDQLSKAQAGGQAGPAAEPLDLAPVKAALADLSAKAAATDAGLQKLQTASAADKTDANKDLNDKIVALQSALLSVQSAQSESTTGLKSVTDKASTLDAGLAKLQSQTAASQSDLDALRTQQKSLEGKTNAPALAVLAESLNERIARGQPFTAEISALESVDADPAKLAILRPLAARGVPTAKVLDGQFDALSEHLMAAAHQLPPGASYWDRLKEGASSLVTIHKEGDISATDPTSRLAEVKDALLRGDVTGAAGLWAKLPASVTAKPEAAVFAAALNAHAEASLAAKAIETAAIAALGVKKS